MKHLVVLDAHAGELEKILSGVKTMLIKESVPAQSSNYPVHPGDHLFFLRGSEDRVVRVTATVVSAQIISRHQEDDLPHALKAMQPKLHLTEDQYNYWSAKQEILLVEFGSARKINHFQADPQLVKDQSDWISFE